MERLQNRETEIRNRYVEEVKKVLLGPGSENMISHPEVELISENPKARYVTGILYSVNDPAKKKFDSSDITSEIEEVLEEVNDAEAENKEENLVIDNNYFPSTMGLTFYCEAKKDFQVGYKIESATYAKVKSPKLSINDAQINQIHKYIEISENNKNNIDAIINMDVSNRTIQFIDKVGNIDILNEVRNDLGKNSFTDAKNLFYKLNKTNYYERVPFVRENFIEIKYGIENHFTKELIINENYKFEIFVKVVPIRISAERLIHTVTTVVQNTSKKDPLFQTKITLNKNKSFNFVASEDIKIPNLESLTTEEAKSIFLYRNKKTYGVGHGVSVVWEDESTVEKIETEYLPEFETIPMSFEIDNLNEDILTPESYLITQDKLEQINKLKLFVAEYEKWIDDIEEKSSTIELVYKKYAEDNIRKCKEARNRIKKSIKFLEEDNDALKCFNYANEAILLQRYSDSNDKLDSFKNKDYTNLNQSFKWRPFQLAFILHSLESVLNEKSDERDLLDLMYVTTGGGKTEAYLFLIAMVILYRRLKYDNSEGVSVIMRYTLRLLTSQQFERATQLICVLEFIRRNSPENFGVSEISIGLWIGGGTENKIQYAKQKLGEMVAEPSLKRALEDNVFQVLKCPWCNEEHSIIPEDDKKKFRRKRNWGYCEIDDKSNNYNMKCMNKECPFSKGLPIYVVDESIYKVRPTLIFGTVDKFAQLPLREEAQRLFASDSKKIRRPELIIQDELHLISGPLGSIVGLYEASFDYILQDNENEIKPKYIASTATIKNSEQQVKGLFDRNVTQFPPDGLEVEDNFFIKEEKGKSGRKYLGIMPTGKSLVTTEVRLTAIMIQALNHMEDMGLTEEEKDMYWTSTGYFNSIRELGKVSGLLMDDTKEYIYQIANRNNSERRNYYYNEELTSRIKGNEIPEILRRLEMNYGSKTTGNGGPTDTLLATNMISVGIDISRLNSMFVVGQPKLTSEYIQATSRVGRKNLGIVFSLYNSTRSRDRSHYETFYSYHQNMYKYVESSSVTPFSLPALDKALAAVIVNMARNTDEMLSGDTTPSLILDSESIFYEINNFLINRLKETEEFEDFYEKDAIKKINDFENKWVELAQISTDDDIKMHYHKHDISSRNFLDNLLLKNFGDKSHGEATEVMNSMRDVEETCSLKIIGGDD